MAQKEYVKTIVHQLSLQRLTDTEIAEYLVKDKGIVISRARVNQIKNGIERQAARWYIELKQSQNKYIANYKERLDSLLSYQRILHDIIKTTKREDIKIKAVSALHSIEMDILNLYKQLPEVDIVDNARKQVEQLTQEEKDRQLPIISIEDINGAEDIPEEDKKLWHNWVQCDGCKRYWRGEELLDYHKRKATRNSCAIPNVE
jgi:hypothetical protein